MPKVISEEEKCMTIKALQQAGISLIKTKGIRNITVDDITKSVGLAKGSFYLYYKTKESFIYEVLKISEKKIFDKIMNLSFDTSNFKVGIEKALHDIYLAPDSIALYVKSEDIEHLMRKLPSELREQEYKISHANLFHAGEFFNIPEEDRGTLAYLMNALQFIAATEQDYGKKNKQQSLELLVCTIADFLCDNVTKKKSQ